MEKSGLIVCLAIGTLFVGGCQEGSYSVEHKSEVEVSTDTGIKASTSYKETRSDNGTFEYKINDFNLLDGKTEIYLSITNHGDKEVMLTNFAIKFSAKDDKNKVIREGNCEYPNLSIKLPPEKEIYQLFVIQDNDWKAYRDSFNVDFEFYNVQIDQPIEK